MDDVQRVRREVRHLAAGVVPEPAEMIQRPAYSARRGAGPSQRCPNQCRRRIAVSRFAESRMIS